MIIELGHFALILAALVGVVQMVVPLIGAHKGWRGWMSLADPASVIQLGLVSFSFAALTYAFVVSDFSVELVASNSHSAKPMLYKVSGVWGNHEGSMLLWLLILVLFGACASLFGGNLPPSLKARVLGVQAAVSVAFYGFILFTSNPFERLEFPPFDGRDLNPLLQDPGLAFHPPFLYLGYVGLSMAFSFAIAALLEGRVDAAWGRWVRPWTLAAWVFLTIGIALGSWWAYYELGWGGFWFWDPVENASFMPWLLAAALLHSAIVVEKRESLKAWTILLAILAFGFSLLGTFIVRSGVLTSVHAFANDPERGVFILAILAIFTGGGLLLFALRASAMEAKGVFSTVSRETALVANNVLLAVSCFVVFVGTIWPLLIELASSKSMWQFGGALVQNPFYAMGLFDRPEQVSVGPPFFNAAFTPFMVVLAIILPVGAVLAWKRGSLGRAVKSMVPVAILAIACGALAFAMQTGRTAMGPIGVVLGVWVVGGATMDIWLRTGRGDIGSRLGRLARLPRADWGKFTAHSGLGITVFAVAALLAWETEDIRVAQVGDQWDVGIHTIRLNEVGPLNGPNYYGERADFTVLRNGRDVGHLYPEKRIYPVASMPTTEAGIRNGVLRDVYVVLGDPQTGGGWAARTYIKPFANWVWGGAILMAIGGFISLSDRRLRVAAGAAKAKPQGVPAE
ncbi:heme lyase CcmF/NrfE family subunit [Octadecabacter sp. 1_MG-2023]|uniref:heme lyase CcmF/NrfE family subunit n=1 Tax=unclassified Octadecabacter TaxID=196158 RepID=UPI001C09E62A|nr:MULTISPECIES: heme lyase CcmF/NrfE family subunit [unclassified Octadecabacter]MBU2993452.1 heme lyase CcmF/NrfE family subunit [Octadecabacter sp. B2R22]MDO6733092.1 heme lyase CcmF/NrfE family subunit [Octadecabacter sp. 1_MG-2023]